MERIRQNESKAFAMIHIVTCIDTEIFLTIYMIAYLSLSLYLSLSAWILGRRKWNNLDVGCKKPSPRNSVKLNLNQIKTKSINIWMTKLTKDRLKNDEIHIGNPMKLCNCEIRPILCYFVAPMVVTFKFNVLTFFLMINL